MRPCHVLETTCDDEKAAHYSTVKWLQTSRSSFSGLAPLAFHSNQVFHSIFRGGITIEVFFHKYGTANTNFWETYSVPRKVTQQKTVFNAFKQILCAVNEQFINLQYDYSGKLYGWFQVVNFLIVTYIFLLTAPSVCILCFVVQKKWIACSLRRHSMYSHPISGRPIISSLYTQLYQWCQRFWHSFTLLLRFLNLEIM